MGGGRAGAWRPAFPGNLGASLLHPGAGSSEYHLVYRFEDDESLAAWERSSERRSALAHGEDMVDDVRYPARPGWRASSPVPTARAPLAADRADHRRRLRDHVALSAAGDPAPAGWPLEARLLFSAVVVVLLLGQCSCRR